MAENVDTSHNFVHFFSFYLDFWWNEFLVKTKVRFTRRKKRKPWLLFYLIFTSKILVWEFQSYFLTIVLQGSICLPCSKRVRVIYDTWRWNADVAGKIFLLFLGKHASWCIYTIYQQLWMVGKIFNSEKKWIENSIEPCDIVPHYGNLQSSWYDRKKMRLW